MEGRKGTQMRARHATQIAVESRGCAPAHRSERMGPGSHFEKWGRVHRKVNPRYDAGGRRTERRHSNGLATRYTYHADNSMKQVQNLRASGTVISQHDYTYDLYGNRLTHDETGTANDYTYVYDELNRW